MKKIFVALVCVAVVATLLGVFVGCDKSNSGKSTFEIAVVTDVGQLMDGGFNQGTWEGAQAFAQSNGKTVKYYQPQGGSDATDADRIAAMRLAITNGAKIIVAPGFMQANAMTTVALENPGVKFVFIDGWTLTDSNRNPIPNVTAVCYKEQESGYMAGYAAVMDGYRKLGGVFGGGGSNPACCRFAYGYVQGIKDAAAQLGIGDEPGSEPVEVKISFNYGDTFSASNELKTMVAGWYAAGTEVIFSCGGSMVESVRAAAEETDNGKIIGVDVDQANLSQRVITSAVKGLSASVIKILGQFYAEQWDAQLGGQTSNLGAADDATGLPIATSRFQNFTAAQYQTLFAGIKAGTIRPDDAIKGNVASDWTTLNDSHISVELIS